MQGSTGIEKFKKGKRFGEDYAAKGRKLNKRDRKQSREDKRNGYEDL